MMTALFIVSHCTATNGDADRSRYAHHDERQHADLARGVLSVHLHSDCERWTPSATDGRRHRIAHQHGLGGQTVEMPYVQTTALAMFVVVGAYLAFQGDVRSV